MGCAADNHKDTCHLKGFLDSNFNQAAITKISHFNENASNFTKQLLPKYHILTKMPQISHIHKNRNF